MEHCAAFEARKPGQSTEPPILAGNITIFRQTSTHLQMVTTFGLELVIQLQPIFQVYITVGPQFRGQTRGEPLSCWSLPKSASPPPPELSTGRPGRAYTGPPNPGSQQSQPEGCPCEASDDQSKGPSWREERFRHTGALEGQARSQLHSCPGPLRAMWQFQWRHKGRLHNQHGHGRGHCLTLRGLLACRELSGCPGA